MYALHLRSGKSITSEQLCRALYALDCQRKSAMTHLAAVEELEERGMRCSNQDRDVLSAALNFLDAVNPEHGLRD